MNDCMFLMVLLSFVVMQLYADWQNYQLRISAPTIDKDSSDVIKITGTSSGFVIAVASVNLLFNLIFPLQFRNQNFYLSKDLVATILTRLWM